ncbi:hypothetical protein [Chryseobacterium daecheongense]|uniref:Uncharacterized protein n=1 Tax=Chryseobacterium daecheongense TaxID=192389 RepID=A0A3N0W8K1_9FLAO|nr:hypothetical protein [Chryseobacterium daecheongense]ROI00419.1 hypothetical protein EGI05_05920 [Chryseobacterium daecheongense]TDX94613.1 hypothetical protein BCF50_0381 [Chryseobacterium daecheongense]
MKKTATLFLSALFVIIFSAVILYAFLGDLFTPRSEFDITDKQNDKIVHMFNTQIEKQIEDHTQSTMHPGYIPESRQNTTSYLKTIRSIESYSRYGVKSTQPRNYLELNITFNNGTTAEKVYTGHPCSGYMDPCLLMKVEMKNGKAVKIFTNGQEKKGSPEWIIPDLNVLIEKAISYDIQRNHDNYFPPSKTQKDFDKEWEDQQ